jgi:hypothetical protein
MCWVASSNSKAEGCVVQLVVWLAQLRCRSACSPKIREQVGTCAVSSEQACACVVSSDSRAHKGVSCTW